MVAFSTIATERPSQALKPGEKLHKLYGGEVEMLFRPDAPRYRYTVTDYGKGMKATPVRGVTTVLRDILDKPDLMRWPMNMSHTALFGAKFDETLKDYVHDWKNALIQPHISYTEEQLHESMLEGARAHTKRADRGKDIGTMAHKAVELYLKGKDIGTILGDIEKEFDAPEESMKVVDKILLKFDEWWKSLPNPEVIFTEKPIYSRKLNYAGTMDMFIVVRGKGFLLDFKTTNRSRKAPLGIYGEYFLQLGGYSYALQEEQGVGVDNIGIVTISKEGQLGVLCNEDLGVSVEECERSFAFAVRMHDWLEVVDSKLTYGSPKSILNPLAKVEGK